ncbi:MAG: hypothetical protein RL129_236 [Actinomycetota bacterium]|jgi:hypothetical protein
MLKGMAFSPVRVMRVEEVSPFEPDSEKSQRLKVPNSKVTGLFAQS